MKREPLLPILDYASILSFLDSTREIVSVRTEDSLLILRPNRLHRLNKSGAELLAGLYQQRFDNEADYRSWLSGFAADYAAPIEQIEHDLNELLLTLEALLKERYDRASAIGRMRTIPFSPESILYPVISEIALTYGCQNKCDFCYASSPYRRSDMTEMSFDEVVTVIRRIAHEAHVPTLSFTGGEPTLREDLPELVAAAVAEGLRVNLISNGIRLADERFVERLVKAGLHSAQISLESHRPDLHDEIVGRRHAFTETVAGIRNLQSLGIYVHTNTTISMKNRNDLIGLLDFAHSELSLPHISLNMIIRTGEARSNDNRQIDYTTIGAILTPLIDHAAALGLKIFWYSPTPYCIFNPMEYGLGAKSCSAVSGLLSVNPAGEVVPCSSYEHGIGSLLHSSFEEVWQSDQALYFRERRYLPPVCRGCENEKICAGACPLYWEEKGGFSEIEERQGRKRWFGQLLWRVEKALRLRTGGVLSRKGASDD